MTTMTFKIHPLSVDPTQFEMSAYKLVYKAVSPDGPELRVDRPSDGQTMETVQLENLTPGATYRVKVSTLSKDISSADSVILTETTGR